jgi:hypothetical protein
MELEKARAFIRMMHEEGCAEYRDGDLELKIQLGAVGGNKAPAQEVVEPEKKLTPEEMELRKAFRTLPPQYAQAFGVGRE